VGIMLDVIVVAIIMFSTFIGYKRGLINVIFNLCAFLVAIIITMFLYTPITNWIIENTEFDNKLESIIIENGVTNDIENTREDSILDKYVTQSIASAKNSIVESTSTVIAQKIIGIIVAIALFIVVRILLTFVKTIVNGIASLPIIKQLNEIGGLAYGIIMGFLFAYLILAVIFFVNSVNSPGMFSEAINSSCVAKFLYSNNIILNIIF